MEALEQFLLSPVARLYLGAWTVWAALMAVEAGYGHWRQEGLYDWRDTLANLVMYLGYFAVNLAWVPLVFVIYTTLHEMTPLRIGMGAWHSGAGGFWWEWLLLFLLEDLCFYLFHRSSHRIGWLWASHVTHHSSNHFNLSVALRQTWTPFVAIPFWLPLPLLGFDPLMIMTVTMFSLFYQLFLHTQLIPPLGPLEYVFNTPSHHRLHHGVNRPYLDRNFGGVLIIWDRLFGTFARALPEEPVRYGIRPTMTSFNPVRIAFGEWWRVLSAPVKHRRDSAAAGDADARRTVPPPAP